MHIEELFITADGVKELFITADGVDVIHIIALKHIKIFLSTERS